LTVTARAQECPHRHPIRPWWQRLSGRGHPVYRTGSAHRSIHRWRCPRARRREAPRDRRRCRRRRRNLRHLVGWALARTVNQRL